MKNTDFKERATRAYKFRVLDAVIIILIIASVVGIYFRYNVLDTLTQNKDIQSYTVSFSINNIRYSTPSYFHVNDKVYFADTGEEMGTLIERSSDMPNKVLSETPSSQMFLNDENTWVEVFYPNDESRVDASGRMVCNGRYSDQGGFLINGSRFVASGQSISIKTEMVTVTIVITDIKLTEQTS